MKYLVKFSYVATILIAMTSMLLAAFTLPEIEMQKNSNAGGELSFTVRTVTASGNYSPKHVLAIWIEHDGDFVKTRKAMANQRKQYLYTWKASSDYNVVDAITGATLTSHQTHTVTWDCTDLDGNIVPDGEYDVYAEFTDKHAQGPLYTLSFTKGADALSLSPGDETYFKDIELEFTPMIAGFSSGTTALCSGEPLTFTDESVNATSWEWAFGDDATPAAANTQGPHTVIYSASGPKTISLTINGNITETKADYIQVAVSPVAGFSFESNALTVDFTNLSVNAVTYLWEFGDGNTSTDSNPTYTYAAAGDYNATLHASYLNCDDQITLPVSLPLVGYQTITPDEKLRIYPNPSSGIFILDASTITHIEKIDIFAPTGILFHIETVLENNNNLITINATDLDHGLYFLQLTGDNMTIVRKIIIQ